MARKPDIQYIGQFYVHGSAAKELARQEQSRKAKTTLPEQRVVQVRKVYVDPVAVCGILVAAVMLVVMVFGAVQIHSAWQDYETVAASLNDLQREHAVLEHGYKGSYDLADIQSKAAAMGMIPASEAETIQIQVHLPEETPELTWWEDLVWLWKGMFE